MKHFVIKLSVLVQLLLVLFLMVPDSDAAVHTLQVKDGDGYIIAKAVVDDATPYTGLYSLVVDGSERLWQQWFWYRIGPSGMEKSLESLPLTSVTPPSLASPNTLSLTYTLADTFDITVAYVLTYPAGGTARLQKNVTISNISTSDLDYHLFEYSDFDISDLATQSDNVEMFAGRVYQNGDQADGSGVVIIHESSLPPTKYDLDNNQIYLLPEMKDDTPSDLSIPQTTYGYGDDMQFAQQWDLTIPAGQSLNFTINEDLYYTKPVTAAKTHAGCVSYGGQADYAISFDNLANSVDNLSNIRIIDFLPADTVPATDPPADGATYEQASNSVSWSLPSLAAGAGQQSRQLSITVNSASDITNELLLVSDQAFPTRITDPAALCNHPPLMGDIPAASVDEGATFTYQVVAMDSDADTLSYGLNDAPDGMAISATGLISYPAGVAGTYVVTVTVTDSGVGNISVSKTFTLTVKKVNHPPVITSTPLLTANDYQLYTYSIAASDPDGDSLSYGFITKPQGMTITGNLVSWTPTMAQAGNQAVQIVVNDGNGQYVYQEFTIVVTHVNRPPVISTATLPPATATVGTFYSYRVVASDPDGNALSYSLTTKPAGMTIGTTGVIGWTPTADQNNQLHAVTAQVSDGQGGTASYSFSITVGTVSAQDPVITWAAPAAITYGTQLSATQLNATANVPGSFTYTPAAGSVLNAGTQTLSLQFTPTDTTAYNSATASVSITVNKAAATVALSNLAQTYDGTARAATVVTSPAGLSTTITYNSSSTAPTAAGTYTVVATINESNYSGSTTGSLVIDKATPLITWPTPAEISYGTALSATQLNATADVAGTFTYTPASGSVLNAGPQTLALVFTPSDTVNYNTATSNVSLTVNKAVATITLGNLNHTYDGSAKSATVTTNPAGLTVTITYDDSATVPTTAGTYAVIAAISDSNYSGTTSGSLIINKATPLITWPTPAAIYAGSMLTSTQLNATASVAGTFVYTPPAGTVINMAGSQTLSVAFTPSDSANYNNANAGVTLTVNDKLNPVITWPAPEAITYGTALSATQLNATADVAGTFTYTPATGAVLNAGPQTLSLVFTPSDTVAYNTATSNVSLTVNKAAATVTLSNLSHTYDGSAKTATAITTPSGLTVSITYDGNATAPTAAGTYNVIATINDANYSGSASGTFTITAIVPAKMVRVMGVLSNIDYNTLQEAYADPATLNGMTILAQAATFSSFTLDRDIGVTIKGGFDSSYQNNGDVSRIAGVLTVQKGSLVVENLVIQ
ncbi:MAG: MBG domain-containing protein [Geobacteraceae bacterium]|nr:MBG domain-containing protein [Geobacteraceae bacterium]